MKRALVLVALLCGCGDDPLSVEELMDPETCMTCHPNHYREWSGSMHAYAADDPVFLAMNRRGQEETNGALGDFCVKCHAPLAVALGQTTDGLNLADVPQKYKGVTCYFCHQVTEVAGQHNNPLVLAMDQTMRGGIADPVKSTAHRTEYSLLHDSDSIDPNPSSSMCGSCHDIVTPAGVHLERTYAEWRDSVFNNDRPVGLSCNSCHMKEIPGTVADVDGVPLRDRRDHTFASVDVAITDWPEKEAQLVAIDDILFGSILPKLCVTPSAGGHTVEYNLDNVFSGHAVPSGAGMDRRFWAEITVWRGDQVVLETGVVAVGQPVAEVAESDPQLWQIRDYGFKENGDVAHMFWDVRETTTELLPFSVTNDPTDPRYNHSVSRFFDVPGEAPTRATAVVHVRPIGLDVMDDLIGSGHLDPSFRVEIPTFTLDGSALTWTDTDGFGCIRP